MTIDPFAITTGIASAVAAAGWIYAFNRKRVVRCQDFYQQWQDGKIRELQAENKALRASQPRQSRREATIEAFYATTFRPRSEVVADVAERREQKNSTQRVAAKPA